MGVNGIDFAKVFQKTLDKQIATDAATGWMEANAERVKYEGGNEIKIPRLDLSGLAEYDRDEGFKRGSVKLQYDAYKMTMDRGRSFQIDAADVDETNFALAAGEVLGEFQRTKVIPEIDAYRISKIAEYAEKYSRSSVYAPSENDILSELMGDIEKVRDEIGYSAELYVSIAAPTLTKLSLSTRATGIMDIGFIKNNGVELSVRKFDGAPIIPISSKLMKNGFDFKDGKSDGQEDGGFSVKDGAKSINWFICARFAPIAVSKTDVSRIFDPMTNQTANAWKIDYRKYHDIWLPTNAAKGIWVSVKDGE